MDNDNSFSAIILAAGKGLRMGSSTKKQFIEINNKPLLYYPLRTFNDSLVSEIIVVTTEEDIPYVVHEIAERYSLNKVKAVVAGGDERYLSVYEGLKMVTRPYVLIHDGARCCISQQTISEISHAILRYGACVAAVPSTDTVKIADDDGFVDHTPMRSHVWSIQTPQGFDTDILMEAYKHLFSTENTEGITDDATVVERAFPDHRIRLVTGSYDNIKVTNPNDLMLAEALLREV